MAGTGEKLKGNGFAIGVDSGRDLQYGGGAIYADHEQILKLII